jgi:hypothetical protein
MKFPSARVFSVPLGVAAGLLTLLVALALVLRWSQHETYRTPPVSQVAVFYGVALVALLGITEVAIAFRARTGDARATGMTLLGLVLFVLGVVQSAAGDSVGSWLFYVGLVALVAAGFALAEGRRRLVAAIGGILGSIALYAFISWSGRIVEDLFP